MRACTLVAPAWGGRTPDKVVRVKLSWRRDRFSVMSWTRHRNSKRLSPREHGRFTSTPSLGATVCSKCGAIHLPEMVEENGFVTKKNPVNCKNGCGPLQEETK